LTATTPLSPLPYPIYFQNNLEGHTYGAELSANYQVAEWWRLHAGYDPLKEHLYVRPGTTDVDNARNETADPEQRWSLRSSWDLPHQIELDATLRWVGSFIVDDGPTGGADFATVPSYYETDARIGWRPVERLELSIAGQNLLHAYHQEYGYPSPTTEYIQRSVYGKAVWRY
jgi:iron complex outermembrane receptor protein